MNQIGSLSQKSGSRKKSMNSVCMIN